MTIAASGSITGANIRDELRGPNAFSGNLVLDDAKTKWLAEVGSGSIVIPNDLYGKQAIKLVSSKAMPANASSSDTLQLGPDFPGRRLLIFFFAYNNSGAALTVSGVTVNGSAANIDPIANAGSNDGSAKADRVAVGMTVVSGTSCTANISFNSTPVGVRAVVVSLSGVDSPMDANFDVDFSAAATGASVATVDILANGNCFIIGYKGNANTISMTGATKMYELAFTGHAFAIGWSNRLSAQSNRTTSITSSGSATAGLIAFSLN